MLSVAISAKAQSYPKNYFSSPLTIPLSLAGNYGEIRPNHFHYGLDFRTNNKEGYPVIACADGFISRVKVSPYGYGKVIYIDHPNGYTTVYGHLRELSGPIAAFVKKSQYQNQKFEFEYYPKPTEFPVKKGDLLGLSGNSGSSQGPHLHFEIRHTKSEEPINPLLFGFPVKDVVLPVLESLYSYSLSPDGRSSRKKEYKLKPGSKFLHDTLVIHGKGGVGFTGYDKETATGSKNGIYETVFLIDRDTVYHARIDRFSFDDARYVNSHIDYKTKRSSGRNIEKTFVAPNNNSPVYLKLVNRGLLEFSDTSVHLGRLLLSDISGNTSMYSFYIRGSKKMLVKNEAVSGELYKYSKTNLYSRGNLKVTIPSKVLYEDLDFLVKEAPPIKGTLSPVYAISHPEIPLHKAIIISITLPEVPAILKNKLTIVSIDNKGQMRSLPTEIVDKDLVAETKSFGRYSIVLDTIPPVAKHLGFKTGGKLLNPERLQIRASDNLGDIKAYKGSIDGQWCLFDYDAKSDLFTYQFEEKADGKKHILKFECTDDRGNSTVITVPFIR